MTYLLALHPTLAAAVTKIHRSLVYIKTPKADPVLLGNALDILKSVSKLIASHRTVLVELENELPEPGPALFDAMGAPAPGAVVHGDSGHGLRIEEHPVLTMGPEAYIHAPWNGREPLEEELLFALRLHARSRGLDYNALRTLVLDEIGGFDETTFPWVVEQILTAGAFEWPHKCEDCQCNDTPDAKGIVLCWSCKNKRTRAEESKNKKAAKKVAKVATPKNPLEEQAS